MKTIRFGIAIFALMSLAVSCFANAKAETNNEYKAVVDTAYNYFKGAANADQALLSSAFDMEYGHIKMVNKDKDTGREIVRSVPLKEFASYFKEATKDTWSADILSVDIVDNKMAMVKLDFHTPKTHYVDYLVMYKRNDQWKIINKTFVANKK